MAKSTEFHAIKWGDVLKSPKFNEHVRVVNDPHPLDGFIVLDLLGPRTNTFRGVFTSGNLQHLRTRFWKTSFQEDWKLFKLGLEALRLRLAYEYAPFSGLPIFLVNPLPHKQEALSDYIPIIGIICNTYSGEHPDTRGTDGPIWRLRRQ